MFLPTLSELLSNFSIVYIENLKIVLGSIFSSRFPRPQVTGLYSFGLSPIYIKELSQEENKNTNKKYSILFDLDVFFT